jgi:predicted nucleic acid-binding protein
MKPRFADSSYFIALLSPRDSLHKQAVRLFEDVGAPLLTTDWVLCEVAASFSQTVNRHLFGSLVESLKNSDDAIIEVAVHDQFERGCDLYLSRPDKEWSLTDCISFLVMSDHGISEALTADRHFEQAGFTPLMKIA